MNTSEIQRIKQRYGIVGNDAALNRAVELALKIAPVDLSVLITGENGVGKEIFPRIIHDHSLRKGRKYMALNCGAIPEGTIDSELFGHEKGAFTGAIEKREGYFSAANGGTLFLDEVGELPLATQARLLRVLETGEFIPVGTSEVHKTDVRIVAATNVNMEQAIADGKFREDLYYRLNSVPINIPPLRQRGADACLLFRKFALDMSEKYQMPPIRLTEAAARVVENYPWPGNVRQLKNLTENMSVTSEEREITPEILERYLPAASSHVPVVTGEQAKGEHSFENEREILYQILFDLRRDVTELKRIVGAGNYQQSSGQKALPQTTLPQTTSNSQSGNVSLYNATDADYDDTPIQEAEEVKDADAVTSSKTGAGSSDSGSLESMERKSIAEALRRHNGNRRLAAQQLGISERTLYRKIKEYGLE